jgi:Leucine-rich repeat (LRR) protein
MKLIRSFLVILLAAFGTFQGNAQCNRLNDSLALVAFYQNSLGDSWIKNDRWLSNSPISTWYGVTLTAQGCVKSIKLPNNRLNGFIDNNIGSLAELEVLNLSNNLLTGNLPSELTKLSKLKVLALDQNDFNGNIPANIGLMASLQELLLSQNSIAGSIPSAIGTLSNLVTLSLSQNKFFGSIPTTIGNLQNLKNFYADNNKLSGTIPKSLYSLSQLTELWLFNNSFIGMIDPDLGNLSKMQKLLLNNNKIVGPIPPSIGTLSNMVSFNASTNRLTGSIPVEITKCKALTSLQIGHNELVGEIPTNIGDLSSLSTIDLSSNSLTGEIPYSLGSPTNLRRVYIDTNMLVGCFPKSFFPLCALTESQNINANGFNFRGNPDLFYGGDFRKWCSGEDVPKALIKPVSLLCEGSDLQLNGMGGLSQAWSGPNSFVSNIANPQILDIKSENFGTYRLVVEGTFTCRDTTTITVKPIDSPITSVNGPLCEGNTVQFSASGGVSYSWSGPNNFSSTLPNPSIPNASASAAGIYTVQIKTVDCEFERTLEVKFTTLGSVTTSTPSICEGDTIKLSAQLSNGQSVLWTGPNNYKSNEFAPVIANASQINSGEYVAVIKDPNGCESTSKIVVSLTPPVELSLADFPILCHTSDSILLPSSIQSNVGAWSGPGVLTSVNGTYFNPINQVGAVALTFEPSAKCTAELKKTILVSKFKIIGSEKSPSNSQNDDNGSIKLDVQTESTSVTVTYSGKVSGTITGGQGTINIDNLPSGLYKVEAIDAAGCVDTTSVFVRYTKAFYFLPNIINSKSVSNSTFFVKGSNLLSYDMTVYDRWGNIVFENQNVAVNDESGGWRPSSDRFISGVYVYKILVRTLEGDKTQMGNLTVL